MVLPAPFLADQGVNPPRCQLEAYIVKSPDGTERNGQRAAADRRSPGGRRCTRHRHRREATRVRVRDGSEFGVEGHLEGPVLDLRAGLVDLVEGGVDYLNHVRRAVGQELRIDH